MSSLSKANRASSQPVSTRVMMTIGELIRFLESREQVCSRLDALTQALSNLRGNNSSALIRNHLAMETMRWRPQERQMPGISRITLLCDLEPGEVGVTVAKVRALRARIIQRTGRSPGDVDALDLAAAADLLREPEAPPDSGQITAPEYKILRELRKHHPRLRFNVDIATAAKLSTPSVKSAVRTLIDKRLAARPAGKRKGTGLTDKGLALADQFLKESPVHP